MLTVHNISKSFGAETALKSISFNINPGERVGLVGPNGSGKTTLFRILAGEDRADTGYVRFSPPELRVGYLPQGLSPRPDDTIESFLARQAGDPQALAAEVEALAVAVAGNPSNPNLHNRYDSALVRLTAASDSAAQAPAMLAALGLGHLPTDLPTTALSGGQKTRLGLASILLSDPQLLLLDEPTNHLDFDMLVWLEHWLTGFKGAVLMVSHDRAFLDATAHRIIEIDPDTHTIREFTGNYTDYVEQKIAERERQWNQWRDQQAEVRRMKHDIAVTKEQSRGVERTTTPRTPGVRRIAKKVARKALAREKKLERYIESDERIDKPRSSWQMKLEFADTPASSRDVLRLEDLSVGYGDVPLLEHLEAQLRYGARVALVGPNGSGKTTLLKTIAGQLQPLAGHVKLGPSVRIGYMDQEQKGLDPLLNAFETIRTIAPFGDTEARTFLHLFLFSGDDVFTPNASLSYGERARLTLACLVAQGCNFLLLDEPINHLDIPSRARFEQALTGFEGTVLTVVHDRYFIASFASEVWEVEGGKLTVTGAEAEEEE